MKSTVIGIDLAKKSFSICIMSRSGKVLGRKVLSRKKLVEYTANLESTLIAFEACGGSHFWARVFLKQGHQVKMISVKKVKAYAPPQKKNDTSDAEAIAEAALKENVIGIRTKSVDQQDLEIWLNYREQLIKQKVALTNQAHGVALEYGVELPSGRTPSLLKEAIEALEDAENGLSSTAREVIFELLEQAKRVERKAAEIEKKLTQRMKENENYALLKSIPGVGVLTAVAILAHTAGDVSSFKNGRQFAAYIGLVPRQHSTGGKSRLLGITASGQSRIRNLLVVGTCAVLRVAERKTDKVSQWVAKKKTTLGYKKANVALANKTARIVYGVLSSQEPYKVA